MGQIDPECGLSADAKNIASRSTPQDNSTLGTDLEFGDKKINLTVTTDPLLFPQIALKQRSNLFFRALPPPKKT